jgi:hypothetical protein
VAWIESHQELRDHPKRKRLSRLLDISRRETIGLLHELWWWAYDYAAEGDLSTFTDEDIADAIDWEHDPGALIAALTQSGFINDDRQIHDWEDFAQKWIERRQADKERKRAKRQQPKPVQEMSNGHPAEIPSLSGVTGPNHTGPNHTGPDVTSPQPPPRRGGAAPAARERRAKAHESANGVMPLPPPHPPPKLGPGEEWIEPGHPEYSPLVGRFKRVRV